MLKCVVIQMTKIPEQCTSIIVLICEDELKKYICQLFQQNVKRSFDLNLAKQFNFYVAKPTEQMLAKLFSFILSCSFVTVET